MLRWILPLLLLLLAIEFEQHSNDFFLGILHDGATVHGGAGEELLLHVGLAATGTCIIDHSSMYMYLSMWVFLMAIGAV